MGSTMTLTRLLPKSEQDSKEETLALAWARVASLQGSAESLQCSRGCCAWPGALLAGEMPTGLSWPVPQLLTSAQLNIRQRLVWYPSLEMPSWSCLTFSTHIPSRVSMGGLHQPRDSVSLLRRCLAWQGFPYANGENISS